MILKSGGGNHPAAKVKPINTSVELTIIDIAKIYIYFKLSKTNLIASDAMSGVTIM